MDRIIIFDTTLRDGEQAPGFSMNTQEKLEMARQLARLNVDVIEAGFPISSDEDFEAVREVAKQVGTLERTPPARTSTTCARCWRRSSTRGPAPSTSRTPWATPFPRSGSTGS